MRAIFAVSIALGVTQAIAQDSKDLVDANGQYTNRALAIATVAAAQVVEMRCQRTGWIAAAIKKFDGMGVYVDLNEKQDYADTLYFATSILEKAGKAGAVQWCKTTVPALASILGIQ